MFPPEFIDEAIARAGRQQALGARRCRTVLEFLFAAGAVREQLNRALAELGCTELGFEVLTTLRVAAGGPLPPSVIADRTGIFRGTLTDVLARLEAAGLVARRRNTEDRRQLLAELTPRGREQCEKVVGRYVDAMLEIGADLPPPSLSVLESALGDLRRGAPSVSSPTTPSHES